MKAILNRSRYYFLLDKNIYELLKKKVAENHKQYPKGNRKVKLDVVCFLAHLISYKRLTVKNKLRYGYVRLKADYLKYYHWKYKVHMDFLIENGIVQSTGYDSDKGESKGYRLNKKLFSKKIVPHYWTDAVLKKKYDFPKRLRMENADKTVRHVTKWLDPQYLSIDYEAAIDYVRSATNFTEGEINSRLFAIEMLNQELTYYFRDGDDNRLHSILTSLPKDLRVFLRCKGERLQSIDIKSSQPYLLLGILTILATSDTEKLDRLLGGVKSGVLRRRVGDSLSIMIQESMESHAILEIRALQNIIEDYDIYKHLAGNFSETLYRKIRRPEGYFDRFYDDAKGVTLREPFKSQRDYAKRVMMEYMYCSLNNRADRYRETKYILPFTVTKVVEALKKKDKSDFSVFLQNVEAYLVLDITCKLIADANPNIPLYTIHDSIATTEEHTEYIQGILYDVLYSHLGVKPRMEIENWWIQFDKAA